MTIAELKASFADFSAFACSLKGDEKSEAQLFLDKFFRALGHGGVQEAGATLEFRIAKSQVRSRSPWATSASSVCPVQSAAEGSFLFAARSLDGSPGASWLPQNRRLKSEVALPFVTR